MQSYINEVRKIARVGGFIGTHPWDLESPKKSACVVIIWTLLLLLTKYFRRFPTLVGLDFCNIMLIVFVFMLDLSYNLVCLYGTVRHIERWKKVWDVINAINMNLERYRLKPGITVRSPLQTIIMATISFVAFQIWSVIFIDWEMKLRNIKYMVYILEMLFFYQMVWINIILDHFSVIPVMVFNCVETLLKQIFFTRNNYVSQRKVAHIKQTLCALHSLTGHLNDIFGLPAAIQLGNSFVNTLTLFEAVVYNPNTKSYSYTVVFLITLLLLYAVSLISIGDKLENSHDRLIFFCDKLQSDITNPIQREEIIILKKYAMRFRPKFTAKGLFQINRRLLAGFFTSLVSYLIIVMQFKSAEKV